MARPAQVQTDASALRPVGGGLPASLRKLAVFLADTAAELSGWATSIAVAGVLVLIYEPDWLFHLYWLLDSHGVYVFLIIMPPLLLHILWSLVRRACGRHDEGSASRDIAALITCLTPSVLLLRASGVDISELASQTLAIMGFGAVGLIVVTVLDIRKELKQPQARTPHKPRTPLPDTTAVVHMANRTRDRFIAAKLRRRPTT